MGNYGVGGGGFFPDRQEQKKKPQLWMDVCGVTNYMYAWRRAPTSLTRPSPHRAFWSLPRLDGERERTRNSVK